jgi:hypothetical protein
MVKNYLFGKENGLEKMETGINIGISEVNWG